MKNVLFFIAFVFGITSQKLYAQDFQITETNDVIGAANENNKVFKLSFSGVREELVYKELKSFMKDHGAKVEQLKHQQVFADNVIIKEVNPNFMDIYYKVYTKEKGSFDVILGVDLGGAYMSSSAHPEMYGRMTEVLKKLSYRIILQSLLADLEDAEKHFKKLTHDYDKLFKENDRLKDDISDYKDKIKTAEIKIEENKKSQEAKKLEMDAEQKRIEELKTSSKKFI